MLWGSSLQTELKVIRKLQFSLGNVFKKVLQDSLQTVLINVTIQFLLKKCVKYRQINHTNYFWNWSWTSELHLTFEINNLNVWINITMTVEIYFRFLFLTHTDSNKLTHRHKHRHRHRHRHTHTHTHTHTNTHTAAKKCGHISTPYFSNLVSAIISKTEWLLDWKWML